MSNAETAKKVENVEEIAGMLCATDEDLLGHLGMPISDLRELGFEVYEESSPGIKG